MTPHHPHRAVGGLYRFTHFRIREGFADFRPSDTMAKSSGGFGKFENTHAVLAILRLSHDNYPATQSWIYRQNRVFGDLPNLPR